MGPSSASAGADELLRGTPSAYGELLRGHCSDVSAVAAGGWGEGFAHGHSEDWSEAVGELYYYVKYTAVPDPETGAAPDFGSCAGLAYPGALIGWAPTWNPHGMFLSVNTLVPRTIRVGGGAVSTSFIQRHAMCGIGQGRDLEQVVAALGAGRWSDGASLNVVDSAGRAMANVETHQDRHDTRRVTAAMGNASHFNSCVRRAACCTLRGGRRINGVPLDGRGHCRLPSIHATRRAKPEPVQFSATRRAQSAHTRPRRGAGWSLCVDQRRRDGWA